MVIKFGYTKLETQTFYTGILILSIIIDYTVHSRGKITRQNKPLYSKKNFIR